MSEIKFRAWMQCPYSDEWTMVGGDDLAFEDYAPLCDLLKETDTFKIMQYIGRKDKNGTEIYEGDVVRYFTTYFQHQSSGEMFGTEPHMEFDCGGEMHRKYEGVIKFFPSTGFILANVKVYECPSEGDCPHTIKGDEWEYTSKQSTKIMSCTKERCEIIGNIHENPELLSDECKKEREK
jgi:uncharacterized phage protein (TIGR01671 family)